MDNRNRQDQAESPEQAPASVATLLDWIVVATVTSFILAPVIGAYVLFT